MKEKWIRINTIEGYENVRDCYWISNSDEDIIINRSINYLVRWIDKGEYKRVGLRTKDGGRKWCYLHILKAKAFLFGPNPLGANVVRHLDDCKTNNALTNLAWGTVSDNIRDSMRNGKFNYQAVAIIGKKTGAKNGKITSKPVKCIETGITYPSACEASRKLGVPLSGISLCCNGKRKTAGKYHWEFVNPITEQ